MYHSRFLFTHNKQDLLSDILNDVISTCSKSCLSEDICDTEERRCIRALQYFSKSSIEGLLEDTLKWALLTDNNKVLVAIATMVPTDKIITLDNEVRVHSGLLQG